METATPLPMGTQVRGMIAEADERIVQEGLVQPGDLIVVVAGSPGGRGGTNRVLVHRVGSPTWPPAKLEAVSALRAGSSGPIRLVQKFYGDKWPRFRHTSGTTRDHRPGDTGGAGR